MDVVFMLAITLLAFTYWIAQSYCSFCKNKLQRHDYMANGKVRYRRKGTEWPVCRCCGRGNPNLVD